MKNEILLELAARWEKDAQVPPDQVRPVPDDTNAEGLMEGVLMGSREAKRECADALRMLVKIIP